MKIWKPLVLLTALLYCTGIALAQESYKQSRANLTIRVASFSQAADDLREVTSQFDASIQNLNLHRDNDSGNANIRVAPDQLAEVVRELSNMGLLENQSQSVNDFSSNFQQYQRRMKVFRLLQEADMRPAFAKLPSELRGEAEAEYQNWIKGQVTSAESSLRSYKEQTAYAEIYVNFTKDSATQAQVVEVTQSDVDQVENAPREVAPPASGNNTPSPEFFVLCLINILGLWAIYRKVDNSTVGLRD
jgi:uncharacterized protein YukE